MWIPRRAIFHHAAVQEQHSEKEQGMLPHPFLPISNPAWLYQKMTGALCNLLLRESYWLLPDRVHVVLEVTGYGRKWQSGAFPG